MSYSLSILGQPLLQGPGGLIRFTATKAQALLWHLAAQPDTAFTRSYMATLLWPDDSESEGRNRLNTTLSRIRQSLPLVPIRQHGDQLQWDRAAGMELDTLRFLECSRSAGHEGAGSAAAARSAAALSEAVALWRGPFLQGFNPSFSSLYEEWLGQERHLWERRLLEALARLVHLEEDQASWSSMIAHCQQALAVDPLQERFHRWLMIAYYQAGDRAAALGQYAVCAGVMKAQLGAAPDPATLRLRDQITRDELVRRGQPALEAPLPEPPPAPVVAAVEHPSGLSPRDREILAGWSGAEPVDADSSSAAVGRIALTDSLTGLYNRRYLETSLDLEIQAGRRPVLALLDMQGLRRINDTLGHDRGDAVLRACGAYFRGEIPQGVVGRVGGGGFAVIFADLPLELAADLIQQVVANLPGTLAIPELRGAVQFAAGLAAAPGDGEDAAALLRAAEGAVYWAKRQRARRVRLARDLESQPEAERRSGDIRISLTGREHLWERMCEQLAQVGAGHGSLMVLEGAEGCGKSRLLAELADRAQLQGWRVATVSATSGETDYQPIASALELLSRDRIEPGADPYEYVSGLVRRLLQVAADGPPVLICIDDLHRAGHFTALALVQLGWALARYPVLIALSLQSGKPEQYDWSSLVSMGLAAERMVREQVSGLDLNGTRRLAIARLGSVLSGPAVRVLHETTGGNPLHVGQVLRAWVSSGVLIPGPTGWVLDFDAAARAPRDLLAALVWRVQELEPEVQETLGLAAVLGGTFRLPDLRALSGTSGDEIAPWLSRAVQEELLEPSGADSLRFAHPILQEACYSSLSPITRRLAHGVAGLLLAESGLATDAQLARHFDAAGMPERSFAYHVQAGEAAAARHALVAARGHLARAWQILPVARVNLDTWWSRLALRLCRVSVGSGDLRTAIETCHEAIRRTGLAPTEALALLLELADAHLAGGDLQGAGEALTRAESLVQGLNMPLDKLRTAALRLRLRMAESGDSALRAEALAMAAEARARGDQRLEGILVGEAARAMLNAGLPRPQVAEQAQRAVSLLPVGGGLAAAQARLVAAQAAATTADALHWLEEALEGAILTGEVILWPRILHLMGRLERASGKWQSARHALEAALLTANRTHVAAERVAIMGDLGLLLAHMGEHQEAIALVATAVQASTVQGRPATTALRVILARCQMAAGLYGDAEHSLALAQAGWGTHPMPAEFHLARLDLFIRTNDLGRAVSEATILPKPTGDLQTYHALLLGRLARRQGRPQEAQRWLNQALNQAGRPFTEQAELAQAYTELGQALHALGDSEAAERSFAEGRAILRRCGFNS